jgi:glycerol-3-phosphate acyltransferase PlsX
MGGDHAPGVVVRGALDALAAGGGRFQVVLVGPVDRLRAEVQAAGGMCDIVHASEVITMDDAPTAALKAKKDSSIAVGLRLQREGQAQAFVSAGNTGAVLSASTLILGRLPGVGRPTIGALVPTTGTPALLVDAGANVDCRPRHLLEFAVMGSIYVSSMVGMPTPRVGLLNVGEEEGKGSEVAREAFALLRESRLNFVGNIEGRDILKGAVDVVVCDGFVGNIILKFGESVPAFFKARFTAFAGRSIANRLIALVARNGLRGVMKELDYQEHGGIPLLGVNGVSIIGHGGSTARAIMNMIFRAEEIIARHVTTDIERALAAYHG